MARRKGFFEREIDSLRDPNVVAKEEAIGAEKEQNSIGSNIAKGFEQMFGHRINAQETALHIGHEDRLNDITLREGLKADRATEKAENMKDNIQPDRENDRGNDPRAIALMEQSQYIEKLAGIESQNDRDYGEK